MMFLLKKILPIFTIFLLLLSPAIHQLAFGLDSTTTTISSSYNPSLVGSSVTFTVMVINSDITNGNTLIPSGIVEFYIDGSSVGQVPLSSTPNGNLAQYTLSTLSLGSHQIDAVYFGDPNNNYAGSNGFDPNDPVTGVLTQNVVSGSETTGQVNILATCGMQFVSGSPIIYGSLAPGSTSSEQTLVLHNTGSVDGIISVSGSNWLDSSVAATNQMNVENTKFSTTSGTYATKTSLSTIDQTVGTLSPILDMNSFWQLQVNLISNTFAGSLTQTMSFTSSC
jgi:hypothetical protein